MTAENLLDSALALLLTTRAQTPEYVECAVPLINILLCEILPYNNLIRASRGKTELEDAQVIAGLKDELACENELAAMALPYGLCAKLLMDDDDMAKVAWFSNQYVAAAEAAAGGLPAPVLNCYPKGAGA